MNHNRDQLISTLQGAVKTAATLDSSGNLDKKLKRWLGLVESKNLISDDGLKSWLLLQADYFREKDREYASYLSKLAGKPL